MLDTFKHQGMRKKLIDNLRKKGIDDEKVLEAMMKVPRHFFFESSFIEHAYEDKAFPIDCEQTISQPYTVAFQTSLLEIKKTDKVLEIGTGSGYQSCIIAVMGAKVYTIERIKTLYNKSKKLIEQLGYNVKVFFGDGNNGLPTYAPFDKIIVTAGAKEIPQNLIKQLSVGGKLIIPVGDNVQTMKLIIKKSETEIEIYDKREFRFVPLLYNKTWK